MTNGLLDRLRRALGKSVETLSPASPPKPPITVRWRNRVHAPSLRWPSARPADAVATPDGAGLRVSVEGLPITGELVTVDDAGVVRRLGQKLQPGWLRIAAWCEAPLDGEVSLIVTALGEQGDRLGRVSMPLTTDPRDWLIEAPPEVRRTTLALRFGGSARLGGVRVEMAAAEGSALPMTGAWTDRTADLGEHVRGLMAVRDYQAVLALQTQPAFQLEAVNRAALTAMVELRLFEAAVAHHERFAPENDAGAERRRLEALGNLGRWSDVKTRIDRALAIAEPQTRAALLLAGFSFTAPDPKLRDRVLGRLVVTPHALPPGDPATLDVANQLAFRFPTPARRRLIDHVLADTDLPAAERILLRGQCARARRDRAGQWAAVNQTLAQYDLEPIQPTAGGPMSLGRFGTAPLPRSAEPPLISAIMTSFNSARTIGYAIASLAAQTHGALEIVLVDDASQDDSVERAQAVIDAHPGVRLTVLRQSANIGTYACRNLALAQAAGAYVFNQDSDDWAHPRKVERLLQAASASGRIGAYGQALRLSPDRGFVARRGFLAPDTSILFKRAPVLEALGGYDPVRAGADGEFHRRMELIFGPDAIAVIPEPLSIIATRGQSLSRSGAFAIDQETGVFSAERNAYRRDYLARHAQLRARLEAGVSPDGGSR